MGAVWWGEEERVVNITGTKSVLVSNPFESVLSNQLTFSISKCRHEMNPL